MLNIKKIFKSIQGEGPYTGWPAIFIRMAGCSVKCHWCDTDYENGEQLAVHQVLDKVEGLREACQIVVITGGEPLQQDIHALVVSLVKNCGIKVQIETSGVVGKECLSSIQAIMDIADVVCSPKTPKVHESMKKAAAWKYVVGSNMVFLDDGLPVNLARPLNDAPVYIQPLNMEDVPLGNRGHQDKAVELILEYGYRLSLQTHKIIGVE